MREDIRAFAFISFRPVNKTTKERRTQLELTMENVSPSFYFFPHDSHDDKGINENVSGGMWIVDKNSKKKCIPKSPPFDITTNICYGVKIRAAVSWSGLL